MRRPQPTRGCCAKQTNKLTNTLTFCSFLRVVQLSLVFLIVSMVVIITAFVYWRCCCFLNSGSLILEVNIQINVIARRELLIQERGLTIRIYVIFVEFQYNIVKLCGQCNCKKGLFASALCNLTTCSTTRSQCPNFWFFHFISSTFKILIYRSSVVF